MRLPFPERIPLVPVFLFATILCATELLQGTNATFSLFAFFYILVAGAAFNVAGGFSRTSGSFIFFNATLAVIVGLCWKAFLGEPADSNLSSPLLTMQIYLFGMCMMLLAAFLSTKISTKRAILGENGHGREYADRDHRLHCDRSNHCVCHDCRARGQRHGVKRAQPAQPLLPTRDYPGGHPRDSPHAGVPGVSIYRSSSLAPYCFLSGLSASQRKECLPRLTCWVIAAASQRFKVSRIQIGLSLLAILLAFRYLVPYSQYGRTYRAETAEANFEVSLSLLSNLGYVREQYLAQSSDAYADRILGYYDTSQGFLDRLQMISIDDALNSYTEQFGTYGFSPVVMGFENIIPHFIWKDKPTFFSGNTFAHEIGILSEDDATTGVSFSSTATAFHLGGWAGIFFLAPALWLMLFVIFDSLCGDTRRSPWGLLVAVLYAHAGPEGDIVSIIYLSFFAALSIIFAAVVGAYVMPVVGTFFIGPEGILIRRGAPVRSIPGRLGPPASSEN